MNDDLISRAALLAAYDAAHKGPPGGARKLIEEAPGVDAAPVVHGRWIEVYTDIACSHCHATYKDDMVDMYYDGVDCGRYVGFEHCPHCGAIMDEDAPDLIDAKPRVMTKDEVMALKEGEVAWLEERYEKAGYSYVQPMMSNGKGLMQGTHLTANAAAMSWRGRRFWTARPTYEQREAETWTI